MFVIDAILSVSEVEMNISFFGHSDFIYNDEIKSKIFEILTELGKTNELQFYLGGYGNFDELAYEVCKLYKEKSYNGKLIFVTPYIDTNYSKLNTAQSYYDEIIYPALEKVPKRLAILKRNEWIIKQSDMVVTFVKFSWGGAFIAHTYAMKEKKKVINLSK